MAELGAQEAMAVQGAQEAMAGGLSLQPEPFYPPKKKFPGEVRGYQEPSGARQTGQYMTGQDRTGQDSPLGPDRQDRTSHRNQEPSWAGLEAEASSGHDKESGALTGSLSNRFHFCDRGAGGWNGLRGHNKRSRLPQTSLRGQDKTRFYLKCSCGHNKTQTRLSWPWRVDWIHGARVSGDRRAWVSGDPAGLSQRRAGGLESAAGRRAWVSGGPVAWSPVNGGPGGAATRELENQPAGLG